MDTKKLRQKILDLAIHGKLVPQDPNDEPASILLERIRAEKERLIKEGKIKQSKKSAKSSDTRHYENVPFEVPESWEWTIINDICLKIGSGSTPRGSNYTEEGIPFFRSQNVYNDGLAYDDIKYISEDVHKTMIGTEVRANDLLLNITGGSLGRCAVVPNEFSKGNVSQHVCILRTIIVLPAYLHLFIISDYFAATMILSGSGREGLPKYSLEIMQFPLPPYEEQKRIVTAVDKWFTLINTLETAKEDLQTSIIQAKSKILDLAIHGKLVPQDPNDEPAIELLKRINPKFTPCDNGHDEKKEIPDSWIWCTLHDSFNITMGSSPTGDALNREKQGVEFHQGKVFFSNKNILPSDIYTTQPVKMAEPHSILLCVRAPVGTVNITDRQICIGRGLCSLMPSKSIDLQYAYYVLQTCSKELEQKATGSTFKAVSGDIVKKQLIPFPPYNEQLRIVKRIEELFAVLDEIQKSIEA